MPGTVPVLATVQSKYLNHCAKSLSHLVTNLNLAIKWKFISSKAVSNFLINVSIFTYLKIASTIAVFTANVV